MMYRLSLIVAAVAVVAYLRIVGDHPCDLGSKDCPDRYFSQSYFEARQKFRALAGKAGATLTAHEVYTDPTTGHTYTMDVAVLQGDAPDRVFVHTSGVHGVEGYAGSAIQCRLLERAAERGGHDGKGPTVVLVHAVNPYGMATWRRFNENNVDLNRNHMTEKELANVKARDANIAGYETFRSLFNLGRAPTKWDWTSLFLHAGRHIIATGGLTTLKRAIVTGQYHDPSGPFYGGTKLEKSLEVLHNEVLAPYRGKVRHFAAVDVHTGLGPEGVDTILAPYEAKAAAHAVFADAPMLESMKDPDAATVDGYDLLEGHVTHHRFLDLPATGGGLGVVQEFGTRPGLLVARAIILENAAWHHARGSWPHEEARRDIRDAFYVQKDSWKHSVIQRGVAVADQAFEYVRDL